MFILKDVCASLLNFNSQPFYSCHFLLLSSDIFLHIPLQLEQTPSLYVPNNVSLFLFRKEAENSSYPTLPWSHFGWKMLVITKQIFQCHCSARCKSHFLLQEAHKTETQNPATKYMYSATITHEEWRSIHGTTQDSRPFWTSPLCFFQGRTLNKKSAPSECTQLSDFCSVSQKLHKASLSLLITVCPASS